MKDYNYIVGERYGRLTVIKFIGINNKKCPIVECKCDCGNSYIGNYYGLRRGTTKSCGCYRSEYVANKNKKHGLGTSNLYPIWKSIKQRCYNDKCKDYKYYGKVGINMCTSWFESFISFYTDMNESYIQHCNTYGRADTSLDRIDPNGNYCKENCKWATWKEQNNFSHKRVFKGNTEVSN